MPYGKTYRRRKYSRRRSSYRIRKPSVNYSAGYTRWGSTSARQGGKGLPPPLAFNTHKGPEKKVTAVSAGAITGFANNVFSPFFVLNGILQGISGQQRIGNKIMCTDLDIRYSFYGGTLVAGAYPNSQVRIIIVYDKETHQVAPTPSDLLIGGPSPTFTDVYRALQQNDRFYIIADILSPTATESDVADTMCPVSGRITKVMKLETVYVGPTASVTEILSGGIFIMAAVNGQTSVDSQLGISIALQFTDT